MSRFTEPDYCLNLQIYIKIHSMPGQNSDTSSGRQNLGFRHD